MKLVPFQEYLGSEKWLNPEYVIYVVPDMIRDEKNGSISLTKIVYDRAYDGNSHNSLITQEPINLVVLRLMNGHKKKKKLK